MKRQYLVFLILNALMILYGLLKILVFLGKIDKKMEFEKNAYKENVPSTQLRVNGKLEEDKLLDDSAMPIRQKTDLYNTGCSHSGIAT